MSFPPKLAASCTRLIELLLIFYFPAYPIPSQDGFLGLNSSCPVEKEVTS